MGDLRDQLRKAGLLGKKDIKRLEHEERLRRKKEGRDFSAKEIEKSREEYLRRLEEKKERDRELAEKINRMKRQREEIARLKDMVDAKQVIDRDKARKFFFVSRAGWVPFLEVSLETARLLEAGNLGIVEIPWAKVERYAVVPRELAKEMTRLDPDCVRFLAGKH